MRCQLAAQLLFFLAFGGVAGSAIREAFEARVEREATAIRAAIYVQLPLRALSEVSL